MITLRDMRVDEFASYRDYFIVEYAEEIVANYGRSSEQSRLIITGINMSKFLDGRED